MKRFFAPLLLLLVLPLAACDSGGDEGDAPGSIPSSPTDNRVAWRAGGTSYAAEGDGSNPTAGSATGTYTANGVGGQGQLSLFATAIRGTTPSTLIITANQVSGEGDYPLSLDNGSLVTFVQNEVSGTTVTMTSYIGESGSLSIAEITDTGMRGSFAFEATNQDDASDAISITQGTFSVAFAQ